VALPQTLQIPGANALTSSSGVRYSSGGPGTGRSLHLHSGADFPGKLGEPVLAVMPGVVVGVFAHRAEGQHEEVSGRSRLTARALGAMKAPYGFGLYVNIQHTISLAGRPLHSSYHHLDSATVRKGDRVVQGQPIGTMGKSGTNPIGGSVHLHLDVAIANPGDRHGDWFFLDPRGFQKWTSSRLTGTTGPGTGKIWPVTQAVATAAFPASGTGRGVEGVDRPAVLVSGYPVTPGEGSASGLPVVAKGPGQPLDEFWRIRRDRPGIAVALAVVTAVGLGYVLRG
jgi:hypothetical protein